MQPTRGDNILDIILVNDPLLINSCNVGLPFGTSDHDAVEFSLTLPDCSVVEVDRNPEVKTFYSYNFKEADYVGLNAYLASVDWQSVFTNYGDDINKCMELFIEVLKAGMDMYVPIKQVFTSSNSRSSVKAFPLYIRQLFRKKTAAWVRVQNPFFPYIRFRNEKTKYGKTDSFFVFRILVSETEIRNSEIRRNFVFRISYFRFGNEKSEFQIRFLEFPFPKRENEIRVTDFFVF
jgi:hypothetical protein